MSRDWIRIVLRRLIFYFGDEATQISVFSMGAQTYDGVRVKMTAVLDTAQILVQVDVGFGDAITPSSEVIELPGFLDPPPNPVPGISQGNCGG